MLYVNFKPRQVVSVPETLHAVEGKASLDGDWKFGLCSCCEEPGLACFTCLCPHIRWSDTTRMAGLLAFPVALLLVLGIEVLGIVFGGGLTWICMTLLGTWYRRKLRTLFGMAEP